MDYNDIKSRLERTFISLNERFDEDVNKYTNVELWENRKGFSLTFGKTDENILTNKIISILHNLASLKDNLKNCLRNNKYDPQIIEDEINNSLHLQVLIDIVNQEKHGCPLTKNIRSFKNPVIKNLTHSFTLGNKKAGSTEINFLENGTIISHGIPPAMFIDAEIHDDKGNLLFRLDPLVETCYTKWEFLAKKYNCI